MKKLLLISAVILAMLATACSKYKYETVAGDPMKTRIYTLDNGLKVYMSVNNETPRLQTVIAVRVGGKNDPAETTGLAHYFEHLMFKGTEQFGTSDYAAEKPLLDEIEALFEVYRQTTDEAERAAIYKRIDSISYEASKISIPNEYDKLMAAIGAEGTNAFTSQDMTAYVEDIPSNQIEAWAKIQSDRFKHPILRGFHTELETVYEEKNMSLTQDSRKIWEAVGAALYPNHPYGTQTVLGTQEHLKNPSITNIKNYHKTYYVPNNMAVCLAGDFDPDYMIEIVDKYFGDMEPNPNLPKLEFEPEQPITEPVVKEIYGLDAARVTLAWRLPSANDPSMDVANITSSVFYNGSAGLFDLNLIQQQKVLSGFGGLQSQPDYSMFVMQAAPKQGQTLEQARDLMLAEVAKLRNGEFDEKLITSTINNLKAQQMRGMEDNNSRALSFAYSFCYGADWADEVKQIERMEKVTKQDVIDWANKYLNDNNYAVVYKREGEDTTVQKVEAPKITPIVMNRDRQSQFLTDIQNTEVAPIEPVYVDFEKDMAQFDAAEGVHVLYKKNELNDLFTLSYSYDYGTQNDPALNLAFDYISYLGTSEMTAEEIAAEMYANACSFGLRAGGSASRLSLSGLAENMPRAMEIMESLIADAQPDENILAALKADMMKRRADQKLNQQANFGALQRYLLYGPEFIKQTTMTNEQLAAITSEELLAKVRDFAGYAHEVLYYGPDTEETVGKLLAEKHIKEGELSKLERVIPAPVETSESGVVLAQYDAKQIRYMQYSNRGEQFDIASDPEITLYNEYFGGGMSSIVFQEMREARGLAYSSFAMLSQPSYLEVPYFYYAFIATQNDKMQQAIEAFDEIINQMPESEAAFAIAKESLIKRLRTERTVRDAVLWAYIDVRDMGLTEDRNKQLFEKLQTLTLEDIKAAQQKWVVGRNYQYGILGDIKDIDVDYLKTLGPIKTVSQEEIFGY